MLVETNKHLRNDEMPITTIAISHKVNDMLPLPHRFAAPELAN